MKGKAFEPWNAGRRCVLGIVGALAIGGPLFVGLFVPQSQAQSQPAVPAAFEVASVRLNRNPDSRGFRQQIQPGGRYSATAIPLQFLITEAYQMPFQSPRISSTPEFNAAVSAMAPAQFDIEAVAPKEAIPAGTPESVQAEIVDRMLQTLLVERFKLVVRRETKDLSVYAIVIGKNGPKLKRSDVQEKECESRAGKPDAVPCHGFNGGRGRGLHADAATIADLAKAVENWAGRPVVDKTGLTGLFNIQTTGWRPEETIPIQASPDGRPPGPEQLAFADPSTPKLSDIFELLGLKLESQKALVETLTLVSIQRPMEN